MRMLATVLGLSLVAVALTGCSSPEAADEATSREAASSSAAAEATSTDEAADEAAAAAAAGGEDAVGDSGAAATGSGAGISPSEQDELEAELAAIERALDAMALPDDTDFGEIEGALQ